MRCCGLRLHALNLSLVAGGLPNLRYNIVDGRGTLVSGGFSNTASGHYSAVLSGYGNVAVGFGSSIAGGYTNTVGYEWVDEDGARQATGAFSFVGSGWNNYAKGYYTSGGSV